MPQVWASFLEPRRLALLRRAPCEEYTFIGNSPMNKVLTLHETREAYLGFMEQNGHGRVNATPSWPAGGMTSSSPRPPSTISSPGC